MPVTNTVIRNSVQAMEAARIARTAAADCKEAQRKAKRKGFDAMAEKCNVTARRVSDIADKIEMEVKNQEAFVDHNTLACQAIRLAARAKKVEYEVLETLLRIGSW